MSQFQSRVFINRTLNLRKIKYVGFDMDHTLVRYNTKKFEELTYNHVLKKLISLKGYPEDILKLKYDFDQVIRGLVLDTKNGNVLKLNQFGKIRLNTHGTKKISYTDLKKQHQDIYIDSRLDHYFFINSGFSVAIALLFSQLVDLKDTSLFKALPPYQQIAEDVKFCTNECHSDGSLKSVVEKDIKNYIIQDPNVVKGLERFKAHGKKLFLLTNSFYDYTKLLLDYTILPFLSSHKHWLDLFDIIITGGDKPRFFYDDIPFLRIDPDTKTMTNNKQVTEKGVYQGGNAKTFTKNMNLNEDDILYIGDHIYGDIVRLKKECNWRTGLVVEELEHELEALVKTSDLNLEVNSLMNKKQPLEEKMVAVITKQKETGSSISDEEFKSLQDKIAQIDLKIRDNIQKIQEAFNSHWGEIMRMGNEESFFARQVIRYSCIYMPKLSDFLNISPRSYLRSIRRKMPHEL